MGLSSKIVIEIDGEEVKDFVQLSVTQSIYQFSTFEIVFRMDTFEKDSTIVLEKSRNYIGKPIKLNIESWDEGYRSSKPAFFFKGIIAEVKAMQADISQMDQVILSGFSPDILLHDNPGNSAYIDKTIKQIAEEILRSYPRDLLKYNINPAHLDRLPYIVQYKESRYDFLRRLASRYGEWFYYDGQELKLGGLPESSIDLNLGFDLLDFGCNIHINPLNTNYISYNPSKQNIVNTATTSSSGSNQLNDLGMQAHKASMKLFNQQSVNLYNHLTATEPAYQSESKSVVERMAAQAALAMSRAHGTSQNLNLKLGCKASIKCVKNKGLLDFGEYIITSIMHTCDNMMTYKNYFDGIPSRAKLPDNTNPGSYPAAEMQSAQVTDNKDPDKLGRVKVRFFWQSSNDESPWIRIAYPNAGKGSGFYFIPEIGEEVMVGFEGGDAERPFVMGSFFNGVNKPEANWSSSGNDIKIVRTRAGNTIELVDKDGSEEISIYQENDKKASHHITMTTGNSPEMKIYSKDKLVIEAKSIEIKTSQGDIKVNSNSKINIESQSDISLKGMNLKAETDMNAELKAGMNVKVEGGMEAEMKGSMSAKVDGGAMATIKGGMVMIN